MLNLYLIRHGTTDWNDSHRYMGYSDPPLNAAGRRQIRELKSLLAGLRPDFLYLSDRLRCRETADLLELPVPGEMTPRLREIHYGVAEGLTYAELCARRPEVAAAWAADWAGYTLPGGENYRGMAGRVREFVGEVLEKREHGDCGVLITHGGCICALLSHYLTGDGENFWKFRVNPGRSVKLCFHATDVFLEI